MAEGTPWELAQELGFLRRKVKVMEQGREALLRSHEARLAHFQHLQTCSVCLNPQTNRLCRKGDLLTEESTLLFDLAQESLDAEADKPRARVMEFTRQLDLIKVKPSSKEEQQHVNS